MVREGATLLPLRIPFGDYIKINNAIQHLIDMSGADAIHKRDLLDLIDLSIDTKKSLVEVCGNICSKQHERFKEELKKADGRLILLIEEPEIETLEDVWWWDNPRLKINPRAIKGTALYKSLCTIRDEYRVDIRFCNRKDTGKEIIKILGGELRKKLNIHNMA
jgi:ribosome-associated protein